MNVAEYSMTYQIEKRCILKFLTSTPIYREREQNLFATLENFANNSYILSNTPIKALTRRTGKRG